MFLLTATVAILLGLQTLGPPPTLPPSLAHSPVDPGLFGVAVPIADADGHAMDAFHAALRKTAAGQGKTRIVQFGASHTAADLLTGYLRRRFQERFGDAGHGFFMPVRPWRTYRHQDLSFENSRYARWRWTWEHVSQRQRPFSHADGLLGLAGMSVRARSKKQWGRVRTSGRGRFGGRASLLELWYHSQPKGGDLWLTIDGKRQRLRTRGRPGTRIFQQKLADGPHRLELRPRGNGEVRLYGAVFERDRPGVVLDTAGINGSRAANMLAWNQQVWRKLLRRRDPALVILAYGTNESGDDKIPIARYERHLRRVLKRVRAAVPKASCVLFGPTDRPRVHRDPKTDPLPWFSTRPRTAEVVAVQRRVSAELGCGFFDAVAATGGVFSIVSWAHAEPRLAYKDFVHLTGRGYRRMADLFYDALMDGFDTTEAAP